MAERIKKVLKDELGHEVLLGYLDTTFHRDDFRRRDLPLKPNQTKVPFIIENKRGDSGRRCIVYRSIRQSGT